MKVVRSAAVAGLITLGSLAAPAAAVPAQPSPPPSAVRADDNVSGQDSAYLVDAHQANLAEIAAGQLAQRKASDAMARAHAERFAADHTRLDVELQAVAKELGVALPATPSPAVGEQLARLSGQSGLDFDRAWVAQQIDSHGRSAARARRQLSTGSSARVSGLARNTASVIRGHMELLRDLSDDLGEPTKPTPAGSPSKPAPGSLSKPTPGTNNLSSPGATEPTAPGETSSTGNSGRPSPPAPPATPRPPTRVNAGTGGPTGGSTAGSDIAAALLAGGLALAGASALALRRAR